jgi:hypothetical protein
MFAALAWARSTYESLVLRAPAYSWDERDTLLKFAFNNVSTIEMALAKVIRDHYPNMLLVVDDIWTNKDIQLIQNLQVFY